MQLQRDTLPIFGRKPDIGHSAKSGVINMA